MPPSLIEQIKAYFVYQYTFLDDLSFIATPEAYFSATLFPGTPLPDMDAVVAAVRDRFLAAGWEGDGRIGVIWIPPFVDIGIEDTWGTYVWHVKQRNDGISFFLSPVPLEFRRIREQNESLSTADGVRVPVGIIHHDAELLRRTARDIGTEVSKSVRGLSDVTDPDVVGLIRNNVLTHAQGMFVRALHHFLDNCYLRLLIEAMNGNRSRVKIRKSRVLLSPARYIPEDVHDEANNWLTVQGVVSDMWKAYMFEPYKAKVEMLFKGVDFDDPALSAFLAKHVALRNCIQHREGIVDSEALDQCGVKEFRLKSTSEDTVLRARDRVAFTLAGC